MYVGKGRVMLRGSEDIHTFDQVVVYAINAF